MIYYIGVHDYFVIQPLAARRITKATNCSLYIVNCKLNKKVEFCVFGGLVLVVGSGGGFWMGAVIYMEIRVLLKIIIFFRKSRKKVVFLQSLFRS